MYRDFWTASCFMFVLGAVCAAAGVFLNYYRRSMELYAGHTEARVVDIVTIPRSGPSTLSEFRNRRVAVFEFFAGGKPVKVQDQSDTYPCPYTMNQRVRICYDPENPEKYQLEPRDRWYYIVLFLRVLAVFLVTLGVILFLMYAVRAEL